MKLCSNAMTARSWERRRLLKRRRKLKRREVSMRRNTPMKKTKMPLPRRRNEECMWRGIIHETCLCMAFSCKYIPLIITFPYSQPLRIYLWWDMFVLYRCLFEANSSQNFVSFIMHYLRMMPYALGFGSYICMSWFWVDYKDIESIGICKYTYYI